MHWETVVPRERSGTPGASSFVGIAHLTLGPGASPPRDLREEPTVAHILHGDDSGHVIVYSPTRAMTIGDRSAWPRTGQVVCPQFRLQPGIPSDSCISVRSPGTNVDKQGLFKALKTATICGNMLSVIQQYLWDTTELVEGCQTENVDIVDWNKQSHPVVKFSRML